MLSLSSEVRSTAESLLEMCLVEYKMQQYLSGTLGICSIYISSKILKSDHALPESFMKILKGDEEKFKNCLIDMANIFEKRNGDKFLVIRKKYSQRQRE